MHENKYVIPNRSHCCSVFTSFPLDLFEKVISFNTLLENSFVSKNDPRQESQKFSLSC